MVILSTLFKSSYLIIAIEYEILGDVRHLSW